MDKNANEGEYVDFDGDGLDKNGEKEAWWERFLDSKFYILSILLLVAVISFSLGRISGREALKPAVRVLNQGEVKGASTENLSQIEKAPVVKDEIGVSAEEVVASKNGTKYHYPWCPGAKQISEKNLIKFNSIEEARAKGYTPASNCKGLK